MGGTLRGGRFGIALAGGLLLALAGSPAAGAARFAPAACPTEDLSPETLKALEDSRCGFLEVPENRTKSGSPTIQLPVAIVPAQSSTPAPDPVIYMEGGPGETAPGAIEFLVGAGINRHRDLIVMGQRGTKFARPHLICPEVDRDDARAVDLVFDAPSTGRKHVAAARACRERLAGSGIDLSAYNTTENAADFADLRRELGIARFNLYGASYGTQLAQTYMRQYPQGIRSVVLDGVVPTDIVGLGWTWSSFSEMVNNIFAACREQRRCRARYPNLGATFTRLIRRLEADPLRTRTRPPDGGRAVQVTIDGGTIVNQIVANQPGPVDLPAAIDYMANGRPERFAERRAAQATPTIGVQALGFTYSATCADWVPRDPFNLVREGLRAFPTFPFSVVRQPVQIPFHKDLCRAWDVPAGPPSIREVTRSSVPTLILSGTFDGKTGAQWGRYVARSLPNSFYVRAPGIGHFVLPQSRCARGVVASFLGTPSSPKTRCTPRPKPPTIEIAAPPCLSRRVAGRRGIGRVRLGRSRGGLLRRVAADPIRETRHSVRWCVKRSRGRVAATFTRRGRSARAQLVTTTVRGMGSGRVRVGARAARVRRAYPDRRRLGRGLFQAQPGSRRIVGLERGRVRFVGVASRRLLGNRSALRRALRRAGVRG